MTDKVDYNPTVPTSAETLEEPMLKYFAHAHLPERLAQYSRPFCLLAEEMVKKIPRCAERTVMLRKLLEAKDCAVRAVLP